MAIKIIQKNSTANTTYSKNRPIKYIVIHYTAGTSSKPGNAVANAEWFGKTEAQASADFVVDDDNIVQINGDIKNRYCWAVGGSKYNTKGGSLYGTAKNQNCISIEVCSTNSSGKITYPNDSRYTFTEKVIDRAVELTNYLMEKYSIDINHVIRHYDVNGKECPGIYGWNADSGSEEKWKAFKKRLNGQEAVEKYYRIRKTWNDTKSQIGAYAVLKNAIAKCPAGYSVFDDEGKEVYHVDYTGFQATDLNGLSEAEKIKKIAPLYQDCMKKTGMLASVGLAQFCLESGYGTTDLAQNANNLHGMKCELSNNSWAGSTWDGDSKFGKYSPEVCNGVTTMKYSEFRKYPNCEASISDRAAYFIGAKNGTGMRYPGINAISDCRKQIEMIKLGGYATDPKYIDKLLSLVTRFDLTQYDNVDVDISADTEPDILPPNQAWIRVGTAWRNGKCVGQIGAFSSLENAKKWADNAAKENKQDMYAFDESGITVYKAEYKSEEMYTVQCGNFVLEDNAKLRIIKLKEIGIDSCMHVNNGRFWIQAGVFSIKKNAENRVAELKTHGFDAFIR